MATTNRAVSRWMDHLLRQDKKTARIWGAALLVLGLVTGVGLSLISVGNAALTVVAFVVTALVLAAGVVMLAIGTGNMWRSDEREEAIKSNAARNAWAAMFAMMMLWFLYGTLPFNGWLYENLSRAQIVYFALPTVILFVSWWVWVFSVRGIKKG